MTGHWDAELLREQLAECRAATTRAHRIAADDHAVLMARITELEAELAAERLSGETQAEQYGYLLRAQSRGMDRAEKAEARLATVIALCDDMDRVSDADTLVKVRAAATGEDR